MNNLTAKIDKAIIGKLTADYENTKLNQIKEKIEEYIEDCSDTLKSAPGGFFNYMLNVYEWEARLYYYDKLQPEILTLSLIAPTPEYVGIFMDEIKHNSTMSEHELIQRYEIVENSIRILHRAPQSEAYMLNHVGEYHRRQGLKDAQFAIDLIER